MNVLETIQRSAAFLTEKGVDSPRLQSELLLAHVLKLRRFDLYLEFDRSLAEVEVAQMRTLVRRRGKREPLQHILGSTSFCGLEIRVGPEVLIPRPETELLAEKAGRYLRELQAGLRNCPAEHVEAAGAAPINVLDFGTGSGCLAIALANAAPQVEVVALDISESALNLARANATARNVAPRIQFIQGDGLSALSPEARFDMVVANPPYIPTLECETLQPEVRDFDPRVALDGGEDGLRFYRHLAEQAGRFLKPGGRLMCEFGDGQAESITKIFQQHSWQVEAVEPDYSGRARILVARPGGS